MPKTSGSGNSKHAPASGIPAKGAAILHPGYRPASGRPRMTPEARARGWETIVAMTPMDRKAREAYRQAEADKAFHVLTVLRDEAEHEMTKHAASVAIINRAEGMPTAKAELTGKDGEPLSIRAVSDKPLTPEQWTAQYGSDLGAAAGSAEGTG